MTYLIAIGIFASVILFIEAGYAAHHLLFNPETQRVKRRLRTWSTMNLRSHGVDIARKQILSEMPWLNDVLAQMPRLRPLQRLLEQSDTRTPMGVFLALSALLALCTFTTLSAVHMNVPATPRRAHSGSTPSTRTSRSFPVCPYTTTCFSGASWRRRSAGSRSRPVSPFCTCIERSNGDSFNSNGNSPKPWTWSREP